MQFNQPAEEIQTNKTKAELEKINQLRNNATILQAEIDRLKGLIVASNYEVTQILNQKAELEASIPKLEDTVKLLSDKIAVLEKTEIELTSVNNALGVEIREKESVVADRLKNVVERENEASEAFKKLDQRNVEITRREEEFAKKNADLEARIATLKNIIN